MTTEKHQCAAAREAAGKARHGTEGRLLTAEEIAQLYPDRHAVDRRDQFAMAALSGLLANPSLNVNQALANDDLDAIAEAADAFADAMMKRRDKP